MLAASWAVVRDGFVVWKFAMCWVACVERIGSMVVSFASYAGGIGGASGGAWILCSVSSGDGTLEICHAVDDRLSKFPCPVLLLLLHFAMDMSTITNEFSERLE